MYSPNKNLEMQTQWIFSFSLSLINNVLFEFVLQLSTDLVLDRKTVLAFERVASDISGLKTNSNQSSIKILVIFLRRIVHTDYKFETVFEAILSLRNRDFETTSLDFKKRYRHNLLLSYVTKKSHKVLV